MQRESPCGPAGLPAGPRTLRTLALLILSALVLLCAAALVRAAPTGSSGAASVSAEPQDTKVVSTTLVRITAATKQQNSWTATLLWGQKYGVREGARGLFFRHYPAVKVGEKGASKGVRVAGQCVVGSVEEATAVAAIAPASTDADDEPRAGDYCSLPVRIPADVYEGQVLELVQNDITFRGNAEGDLRVTFAAALQLRSAADEKALLEKLAADVREIPEWVPDLEVLTQKISKGQYGGRLLKEVMLKCNAEDIGEFFNFVNDYPAKYIGNVWKISETFATWVIDDAPDSRQSVERRARTLKTDEELAAYLKKIHSEGTILRYALIPWFHAAKAAFGAHQAEEAAFYLRLIRVAGDVTQIKAYGIAVQLLTGISDFMAGQKEKGLRDGERAAADADALPDDPAYDLETTPGNDFSRTYWKARVFYQLAAQQSSIPNYAAAAAAAEEAIKLLSGHSHTNERIAIETAVLEDGAYFLQQKGDFKLAEERYQQALEAYHRRQDESGLKGEVEIGDKLATLASSRGEYKLAIERRALAGQLAIKYGYPEKAVSYLWKIATDYWNAGEYEKALKGYQTVLPVYERAEDWVDFSALLQNIGNVYADQGKFDPARESLEKAYDAAMKVTDPAKQSVRALEVQRWQANLFKRQGRYEEAENLYAQTLKRLDPAKNAELLAATHSRFAELLQEAKKTDAAEQHYRAAAELYAKLGKPGEEDKQLSKLAGLYRDSARADRAESTLLRVVEHQRKAGDQSGLTESLITLSFLHLQSPGAFPRAKAEADEALQLATASSNADAQYRAQEALAAYYSRVGDEVSARTAYETAIADARARKDDFRVAVFTWRLGGIEAGLANTQKASEAYQAALRYFQKEKLNSLAAWVMDSQAYVALSEGDLTTAEQRLEESRKTSGEDANDSLRGDQLILSSRLKVRQSRLKEAIEDLRSADQLWIRASNLVGRLINQEAIGGIQMDERQYEDAHKTWTEMLKLAKGYPYFQALAGANDSLSLASMGRFEEAEAAAKESIQQADTLTLSPTLAADIRGAWGIRLYFWARKTDDPALAAKRIDEGTTLLNADESVARKLGLRFLLIRTEIGWGWRALVLAERKGLVTTVQPNPRPPGEPDAAEAAVKLATTLSAPEDLWESLYVRGALWAIRDDPSHPFDFTHAAEDLEASTAILDKLAANYAALGGESSGASLYQADKERPFLTLLDLYQHEGERLEEEARRLREKGLTDEAAASAKTAAAVYAKARNVLDRLRHWEMQTTSTGLVIPPGATELQKAAANYQSLIRQQIDLERRLGEEMKRPADQLRDGVIKTLVEKLEQQKAQVQSEAQLIRKQFPELAAQLELNPEDLNTFVESLAEEEALVEPVLMPGRLVVFVARHQQGEVAVRSFTSPVDGDALVADLQALWKAASNPGSDFSPGAINDPRSAAHVAGELYDRLFDPAKPALAGVKTVLIAASGRLQFVPFHLLLARAPDGARVYLNDLYNIVYLTHAGSQAGGTTPVNYRGAAIVAVGNPDGTLPEAEAEVGAIQATWKQTNASVPPEVKLRQEASIGAVGGSLRKIKLMKSDGTKIFHLATHGEAGALASESFLVFADGRVREDEIRKKFNLSGFTLAVLSGCKTALGTLDENGTGVTGLAREFENGGVKTVLGTLWSLDSEMGLTFMDDFYKRLAAGASVSDAVREARKVIRAQKPHPYYWAPFVLIGQWR